MNSNISKWLNSLIDLKPSVFQGLGTAEAIYHPENAPRPVYARLKITLEPARVLEFNAAMISHPLFEQFSQGIINGVLDVLLAESKYPPFLVKITVVEIGVDEVCSTENAFRMASRKATKKILIEIADANKQEQ